MVGVAQAHHQVGQAQAFEQRLDGHAPFARRMLADAGQDVGQAVQALAQLVQGLQPRQVLQRRAAAGQVAGDVFAVAADRRRRHQFRRQPTRKLAHGQLPGVS
jgi:hypothetical protein